MQLPSWNRAVVKIGSNLIAPGGLALSTAHLLPLARFVQASRAQGREVVLVSSGAVAAGRAALRERIAGAATLPAKQALAAIGQARLMSFWARFFDEPVAQLLLSHDDLKNRKRYVNARNTLRELLALNALPVVNENDSVAVDELKLGDNDNLAAHVAVLADADLLVIVSDVDGLYSADPRLHADAVLIEDVSRIDATVHALAGGAGTSVGTGGMRTKIQAAEKATARGIHTVIVNGRKPEAIEALAHGQLQGTLFRRTESALSAKQHWMLHALPSAGTVFVDAGAAHALTKNGASLLPSGIVELQGSFGHGDAVTIQHGERVLGKGICQYGANDLARIKGHKSTEITGLLGYCYADTVIHRDDLVLL